MRSLRHQGLRCQSREEEGRGTEFQLDGRFWSLDPFPPVLVPGRELSAAEAPRKCATPSSVTGPPWALATVATRTSTQSQREWKPRTENQKPNTPSWGPRAPAGGCPAPSSTITNLCCPSRPLAPRYLPGTALQGCGLRGGLWPRSSQNSHFWPGFRNGILLPRGLGRLFNTAPLRSAEGSQVLWYCEVFHAFSSGRFADVEVVGKPS